MNSTPGKLGKRPFVPDERDITFKAIRKGVTLPKAPARFGHGTMFKDWGMLGNGPDETVAPGFEGAGCCVFSGAAHETMETLKLAGKSVKFTGKNVIDDYSAVTGYQLNDPNTDNGTIVRDALKYRKNVGIVDAKGVRHKIGAFVKIDPKDWDELMTACYVFSAVGIGFEFPDTAWEQFANGEPWGVVPGAQIEGGHYVPMMGRSSLRIGGNVSWARRQGMTRDFYEAYNDETWAIVYPESLKNGVNERGFDLTRLNEALAALH